MQVSLNFAELSDFQLARFAKLFDSLADFYRSRPFNHFAFWAAREAEREIRARQLHLVVRHSVDLPVLNLRPGELVFLERRMREWRYEFGDAVLGEVSEILMRACGRCRAAALEAVWQAVAA